MKPEVEIFFTNPLDMFKKDVKKFIQVQKCSNNNLNTPVMIFFIDFSFIFTEKIKQDKKSKFCVSIIYFYVTVQY